MLFVAKKNEISWDFKSDRLLALNELFVPLLQRQYPEITDFYLPPEGCSYPMAVVSIKKSYPGHARRIMFVIWAITTRMDPTRDILLVDSTPIDYLDFASPVSGLGSKMGLDATNARIWRHDR